MKNKILIIIFIWAIALRCIEVVSGNYLFGFDVGRDMLVARNIIENHKLTLIGAELGSGSAGINGVFQGPGYYYLLAIVYWMFQGNPFGALLTMFIFSVATLIAVYWTVTRMFDKKTALVALLLVGISPYLISQARFIWSPHPASLLLVFFFYFTYYIPKRPRVFAPLAIFFAGLTYHFEFAMTVPMLITLFSALPLIYRISDIKTYIYSFMTAFVVFLPFLLFEIRHGWMALGSFFSYNTPKGPIGSDVWWLRILDHMGPYIASARNSFPIEHGFIQESGMTILIIFLLLTLVYYSKQVFFRFLLLLLAITYVSFLFLNNIIWDYYLIHAHFVYIYIYSYVITRRSKIVVGALGVFLFSMMLASAWRMMISFKYDLRDLGGVEKIDGKRRAIDFVYEDAKGNEFSQFTFMAPIYTYPYEYLFATYGKQKYGYEPGNVKKGLVYLIIEPDASKPWTYKGWLETVIVEGEIIKTVNLSTGHIIQVRQFP